MVVENISKIVVSKSSGVVVGYVLNVFLDNFVKVGYVVVDEETESEYLLKVEDVFAVSDDFVLIEDVSVLEFFPDGQTSLLGLEVLDWNGFSLGKVKGLEFKKNKCEKILTEKCEILTKFIKIIGKNFVFVDFKKNKKRNIKNEFPKLKNFDIQIKAQEYEKMEKVSLSTQSYVGKVCLRDVFGYNNERIALKGSVVTKTVVEKAKRHDRLNQLFFALKRD